jgi:hypothetical protein
VRVKLSHCSSLTVVAVQVVVFARHCALTEVLVNIESHALNEKGMVMMMVMRWRGDRIGAYYGRV